MKRTSINPTPWSRQYGFNQAELIEGATRTVYCSGQTAMSQDGKPQCAGDMRGQITLAFDNLEAILHAADMTLAHVVRLVIYTTDVDAYIAQYSAVSDRLQAAGVAPAQTLLGVNRLFLPQLQVEVEAVAVA